MPVPRKPSQPARAAWSAAYVSSLIEEARQEQIQPAAHIMHVLAGNIEAGNVPDLQTAADVLLEAAERPDRELASHPLPDGFSWCQGCGAAEATVLIEGRCPQCREEREAATTGTGSDEQTHLAVRKNTPITEELLYSIRRLPRPGRGRRQRVVLKLTITGGDNGEPVITILEPNED